MGGTDCPTNLVELTAREHYVAHILLAKLYGGTLWHAVNLMGRQKKYSNRMYERARLEHSALLSAQNKRTKTKPKEDRVYICAMCNSTVIRHEFCHHPKKDRVFCNTSCAARFNGKNFVTTVSRNKGKIAWNKGLPNPTAAENGKKGAAKMSAKAKGRKRMYKEDGTWTWEYPE